MFSDKNDFRDFRASNLWTLDLNCPERLLNVICTFNLWPVSRRKSLLPASQIPFHLRMMTNLLPKISEYILLPQMPLVRKLSMFQFSSISNNNLETRPKVSKIWLVCALLCLYSMKYNLCDPKNVWKVFSWGHVFYWHVQIMKNHVFCHIFSFVNVFAKRICHFLHLFNWYTMYHFLYWR